MRRVLIVACILLTAAVAHADDGGVEGVGGNLHLIKPEHASIRLVSESVYASVDGWNCQVRCRFRFRNDSSNVVNVKMGFPDVGEDNGDDRPRAGLANFRSWIDGKPAKTEYLATKRMDCEMYYTYAGWHTKEASFGPKQEHIVVDEYDADLGSWGNGRILAFTYILKTGASWKGPIGKAFVTVRVIKPPAGLIPVTHFSGASPSGFSRKHDVFRWTLKDLEPKEDIKVSFSSCVQADGVDFADVPECSIVRGRALLGSNAVEAFKCSEFSRRGQRGLVVRYGNQTLRMFRHSRLAVLNDRKIVRLAVPPQWYSCSSQIDIPVASVVRAFGGTASYDKETWTVHLSLPRNKAR